MDLAQSALKFLEVAEKFEATRNWDKALEAYQKRSEMGGWMEEVYYCYYQMVRGYIHIAKVRKEDTEPQMLQALMRGFAINPKRAEAVYEVIKYYRVTEQYYKALPFTRYASEIPYPYNQKLFIEKPVYDWMLLDEISIVQFWTGDYEGCIENCKKILASGLLPNSQVERISNHIKYCNDRLNK